MHKKGFVFFLILSLLFTGCERRNARIAAREAEGQEAALPTIDPAALPTVEPTEQAAETQLIPTETPAPTVVTPLPTGFTVLGSGDYDLTMTADGLVRTYILHVSPAVTDYEPLPLMIVLHGTWGTGRKMQFGLGFDAYADQRGFYVAYPDAYQVPGSNQTARWNDGRDTLESSALGIDDVNFILEMIADIQRKVPVDVSRIYVTGASNGGMMTYRLGCETSGVFAGIAPVIGNIPTPIAGACAPAAPLEVLAINGDADPFIPFSGGVVCENVIIGCEGGNVLSVAESMGRFAAANGCQQDPQTETLPVLVEDSTYIDHWTYTGCSENARVQNYIVRNGGHNWPPRSGQLSSSGQQTGNLDATQVIVDFFIP